MVKNFWKNKKILVLGHTGFKGSWLSLTLYLLGANVSGISLKPKRKKDLYNILNLKRIIKSSEYIDIRNFKKLSSAVNKIKPDIIFHLAAQPLVKESIKNPLYTYETNFMGTLNILEICRNLKSLKSILITTTDKCYLNIGKKKNYKENDPLGGFDPYSSSKASTEILVKAYYETYLKNRIGLATARAGNVIGGGDWSNNRLLPDIMRSYLNKKILTIRNPFSTRPWLYILDVICGYLILANNLYKDKNFFSSAWNFGPGKKNNIKVLKIIKSTASFLNKPLKIKIKKSNFKESKYLNLDVSKSKKYLSWKNNFDIDLSLKETINWYKQYLHNTKNIKSYTKQHILNYIRFTK